MTESVIRVTKNEQGRFIAALHQEGWATPLTAPNYYVLHSAWYETKAGAVRWLRHNVPEAKSAHIA